MRRVLLFSLLALAWGVQAQEQSLRVPIVLDVRSTPLDEVLKDIARQSGIPFSYNPRKLPTDRPITYRSAQQPLQQVLKDLGAMVGFEYSLIQNQLVLKPVATGSKAREEKVTLSGYLKDKRTGEALIGATVFLHELQTGVVTNAFGFYSITVPPGVYTFTCSYIGYERSSSELSLMTSTRNDFALAEEPPVLKEVLVSSTSLTLVEESQTSKTDIRPKAVEERPALFGEMDVIKSLESVPGIKLHSDGSTFYYVRGGSRDQNLVLIDDAPIYNPSHLLGFFSTIIPDAVNDIHVYRGEMPASLGGRLSSVLDVRTKKGNDQQTVAWGNASLVSSKLGIEGPFRKDVSSYLVSGRFSRLKWIANLVDKSITQFQFHDLTGKVNFKLNERNRIFLSAYTGRDSYFGSNSGITWANNAATFRWNHLVHSRLFLNTTLAGSGYDYQLFYDVSKNTRWTSQISNFHLKTDFSYFLKPENEVTFGLSLSGYFMNPGNLQTNDPNTDIPSLSVRNSSEAVLYANQDVKINERWQLNYGLRTSVWTNAGEAFEFVFDANRQPIDTLFFEKGDNYHSYVRAEPRLTITRLLGPSSSLKVGIARNVQNVHLISNSVSPFTSLEVWLPSSINLRPQTATQVSVGYYQTFSRSGLTLATETFYKSMRHQIEFAEHASTLLNPLLERELRFGKGTAYGVETQLKKDEGRLRGWVGYSYSRAFRQFNDLNNGNVFPAFSDRPHQVNIVASYDANPRWNLGVNWNYLTGSPFSAPSGFYFFNGQEVPVYAERNNARLPDYHRLDVSGTYRLNRNPDNDFRHSITFSIYNLYGRKNALFVNYHKTQVSEREFKVPANLLDPDRAISQFYLFQFTPAVTYNFNWR